MPWLLQSTFLLPFKIRDDSCLFLHLVILLKIVSQEAAGNYSTHPFNLFDKFDFCSGTLLCTRLKSLEEIQHSRIATEKAQAVLRHQSAGIHLLLTDIWI